MKQIDSVDELKSIQLNILLKVHQFCVENNIKYSLADGTLLGAVRHKGYIPWDDDIDICMERKDYHRFINEFPDVFKNEIAVVSMERDTQWAFPFAKAYDVRTVLKEKATNNKPQIGVNIDIFPLDDVPNGDAFEDYNKRRKKMFLFFRTKALKWREGRSLKNNLSMIAVKVLLSPFSHRKLSEFMDTYAQKNNGKSYSLLYECCLGMILKGPFPKEVFKETIDMPFEGHLLKVMSGYHVCLTCSYGNYMQLPPIEKRTSHHAFKAYWK